MSEATSTAAATDSDSTDSDDDDDAREKSSPERSDALPSGQSMNKLGVDSIIGDIDNEFDQPSNTEESNDAKASRESTTSVEKQGEEVITSAADEDEPWELEEHGEETITPIPTIVIDTGDSYNKSFPDAQTSSPVLVAPKIGMVSSSSDSDESNDEKPDGVGGGGGDNYDDYFSQHQPREETDPTESALSKTVRFDATLEKVATMTPKDSLEPSDSSSLSDSEALRDDDTMMTLSSVSDRISDHMNSENAKHDEPVQSRMTDVILRPESEISLAESEDLPPPLPPLPPMNKKPGQWSVKESASCGDLFSLAPVKENIPSKSALSASSSNNDLKRRGSPRSESETNLATQTKTDLKLHSSTDSQLGPSYDSGLWMSTRRILAHRRHRSRTSVLFEVWH